MGYFNPVKESYTVFTIFFTDLGLVTPVTVLSVIARRLFSQSLPQSGQDMADGIFVPFIICF